jgi:hypothetical protein
MSDVLLVPRRVVSTPTVSRGWQAGIIVGLASFILFVLVAERLSAHGYAVPSVLTVWNDPDPASVGGRWIQFALIWLIQAIPGSTVDTLTVVTIITASFLQAVVTHDLVKRGWSPLQAALAVGISALHPVMLSLATSGSPLLLYVMLAAIVLIALDRFEAIGDTQSLIVLGLLLAVLCLSWPDSIFFILPLACLLPWAFKDIQNYSAATALFVITLTPMIICVGSVALGGTVFDLPFSDLVSVWASPLHGATALVVSGSKWLAIYGGHPIASFFALCGLCLLLLPRTLLVLLRFTINRSERARPVTGIAALLLPPLAGALASMYFELDSAWTVIALSLACTSAWSITVHFRNWEKWTWIATVAAGVVIAWVLPVLWVAPTDALWRQILLGV